MRHARGNEITQHFYHVWTTKVATDFSCLATKGINNSCAWKIIDFVVPS